ncbi:hypothetical protein HOY80DRAFT_1001819 [Tuber brumale]|nr:hypothetical protein HOY80DRAFT_1001819 [Tuber brumale]
MPQQITRAFTATRLPATSLIFPSSIVPELQCLLQSTNSSNSSSEPSQLSPLSLSLSSPWDNLPKDPASASGSSTELDSPSAIQFNYNTSSEPISNSNSNEEPYINSDSKSDASYYPSSISTSIVDSVSVSSSSASSYSSIFTSPHSTFASTSSTSASLSSSSSSTSGTLTSDELEPATDSPVGRDFHKYRISTETGAQVRALRQIAGWPYRKIAIAVNLSLGSVYRAAQQHPIREKRVLGCPWMLGQELRQELVEIITE